jgi:hypothetical protein
VDLVLGMSMAPSTLRMVLVEGKDGDGATVDQDGFPVATAANTGNAATLTAANQAMAAILGTREGATQGGYRLASTGVTCADPVEADALRDALAAHRVENIMLVSAFLAAAALAQSFGTTIGYLRVAFHRAGVRDVGCRRLRERFDHRCPQSVPTG